MKTDSLEEVMATPLRIGAVLEKTLAAERAICDKYGVESIKQLENSPEYDKAISHLPYNLGIDILTEEWAKLRNDGEEAFKDYIWINSNKGAGAKHLLKGSKLTSNILYKLKNDLGNKFVAVEVKKGETPSLDRISEFAVTAYAFKTMQLYSDIRNWVDKVKQKKNFEMKSYLNDVKEISSLIVEGLTGVNNPAQMIMNEILNNKNLMASIATIENFKQDLKKIEGEYNGELKLENEEKHAMDVGMRFLYLAVNKNVVKNHDDKTKFLKNGVYSAMFHNIGSLMTLPIAETLKNKSSNFKKGLQSLIKFYTLTNPNTGRPLPDMRDNRRTQLLFDMELNGTGPDVFPYEEYQREMKKVIKDELSMGKVFKDFIINKKDRFFGPIESLNTEDNTELSIHPHYKRKIGNYPLPPMNVLLGSADKWSHIRYALDGKKLLNDERYTKWVDNIVKIKPDIDINGNIQRIENGIIYQLAKNGLLNAESASDIVTYSVENIPLGEKHPFKININNPDVDTRNFNNKNGFVLRENGHAYLITGKKGVMKIYDKAKGVNELKKNIKLTIPVDFEKIYFS